jgi:hypothetical protein
MQNPSPPELSTSREPCEVTLSSGQVGQWSGPLLPFALLLGRPHARLVVCCSEDEATSPDLVKMPTVEFNPTGGCL